MRRRSFRAASRASALFAAPAPALALGLWFALALALPACSDGPRAPNLLIVSVDTLRADRLGLYGNDDWGRSTSPHADALSGRGTTFDLAMVPRGQTHPSISAMLTGKYPITTGLRENGLTLLPHHRTLFEHLQKEGFDTGVFVSNFETGSPYDNWVYRGADVYADGFAGRRAVESRNESRFQQRWDDRVEQAATQFLQGQDSERPFAAWVHFYDVHKPYNPPREYLAHYGVSAGVPEVLRAPGPDSGAALEQHLAEITLGERELPDAELRRILGLYDATVTATDDRLGRLLETLAARGALENTIVVFTSDHGDELFDHHRYFFHGNSLYQGVIRIPLLIAGPGLAAGQRVAAPVQNVDIAPTLLELLGLSVADDIEGVSLAPLLRGETDAPPRPYAYVEWQDVVYAITDGTFKYVHNPQHAHLLKSPFNPPQGQTATRGFPYECFEAYDLSADPGEHTDLLAGLDAASLGSAGALPPPVAALRVALTKWLMLPHHEREMSWPGLNAQSLERMEQLGYIGGGSDRRDVLFQESCQGN